VKITSLQLLEKQLQTVKKKTAPCVIALVSKDQFELKTGIKLVEEMLLTAFSDPALKVKPIGVDDLQEECDSFSLFSAFSIFRLAKTEDFTADEAFVVEKSLESDSGNRVLLLTGSQLSSKLAKKIEACGILCEISEPKPWEKKTKAQEWLLTRLAKEGKTIQPQAVRLLSEEYQDNRFLLEQELAKVLTLTVGEKEIKEEHVRAICTFSQKANLWHLGDVVLERNKAEAVKMVHALLEDDVHALQIVRYLRNQIRQALEMAAFIADRRDDEEMRAHFAKLPPKALDKLHEQAKRIGCDALRLMLIQADTLEVELKNSNHDEELLLELFLLSL
jgi:DNA polymerase III delta subunit